MPRKDYTPKMGEEALNARKKARFIRCLLDNGGFVEAAIREARTSRRFVNEEREVDEEFDATIRTIIDITNEQLVMEAYRRGVQGNEKPLSYKGELTGDKVREYSDNLLMFLIKGRMPEFRDGPGAKGKNVPLSDEELNAGIREYLREKTKGEKTPGVDAESTANN